MFILSLGESFNWYLKGKHQAGVSGARQPQKT